MKGEKTKLHRYYQKKKLTISAVNMIDSRMSKFFDSMWNYYPNITTYAWVKENYLTDRFILRIIPRKQWYSLSLDERVEFKALVMVRQYVWKRFHLWNKQFVPRWRVKYAPETDFNVEIINK